MIGDLAVVAAGSYLLGSVPTGFLLARLKKVDVRTTGSGNIGATNVARSAGKSLGALTLLLDAAKGAVPVLVVQSVDWGLGVGAETARVAPLVAGLAALAGHCFPVTLGFRGGKGVATAMGALAVLAPVALLVAVAVFALLFLAFRRVSAASLGAAVSAPAAASWAGYGELSVAAICAMAVLIVYRHRENISRLLSGTEPRFGEPRSPSSSA